MARFSASIMSIVVSSRMRLLLLILFVLSVPSSALKASGAVNFKISEELGVGRVVGELASRLTAIGKQTTFDGSDSYFVVSSSGRVTVGSRVDREDTHLCPHREGPCVHNFVVFAGKAMNVISVSVYVEDVNDNEPHWLKEPEVEVPENSALGSMLDITLAKDADGGNNSIVSYELATPSVYFTLRTQRLSGSVVPRLVVTRELDREQYEWHNLTLLAKDGSAPFFTGTTTIHIRITDQNDHAPKFDRSEYRAWLNEDVSMGHLVLRARATDLDAGDNSRMRYSFAVSTPDFVRTAFAIDPHEGLLTVAGRLNYETRSTYGIQIVATDTGRPPKSGLASVSIMLRDTNDHRPTIRVKPLRSSAKSHRVTVRENAPNGTTIATVTVNDDDEGKNGKISCRLIPDSDFILGVLGVSDRQTVYRISTRRPFDREHASIREATISCTDKGTEPQKARYHLVVYIGDENDNAPHFLPSKEYHRLVREGNAPNARVAAISTADADDGKNARLQYHIEWPPGEESSSFSPFRVNSDGAIVAMRSLDRERNPRGFRFFVVARDEGTPSLSATGTVFIRLADVNDNAPVFTQSVYNFAVDESPSDPSSITHGALVGRVNASDADEGDNGALTFRLEPPSAPFSIDPLGRIVTSGSIDREVRDTYNLRVIATDKAVESPLTATASVIVSVRDINDNAPAFKFPNASLHRLRLSYREKPAFLVARVLATDRDQGPNAELEYHILRGNIYRLFEMRKQTGELLLQNDMSAAHMGTIVLRLRAKDKGVPPRYNDTELELVIDDSPPMGGRAQAGQRSEGASEWEANRLIIICIVLGTGVMCAVLATAICFIARRSPCPSNELHHNGRSTCPLCCCPNGDGSPTKYAMNCEVQEKLFDACSPELDSNGRSGTSPMDTFQPPKTFTQPALLVPRTQSATLSSSGGLSSPGTIMEEAEVCHDSDDDSGRGGSVQLVPGQPDSLMERSYGTAGLVSTLGSGGCNIHGRHKTLVRPHQQLELTPRVGGNYVTAPKKLKLPSSCHVIYEGRQSAYSMV